MQPQNQSTAVVDERFLPVLKRLGITQLSAIQKAVYSPLSEGKSVIGLAPTGSGKTFAFSLPLLAKIATSSEQPTFPALLVVAPSQELAAQIAAVIRPFAAAVELKVAAIVGGANVKRQKEKLKQKPTVIVGTLGRLLELIDAHKLKTHQLVTIVFDEADELLADKVKLTQARHLVSKAKSDVQLGFFSATDGAVLHDLHRWFGKNITWCDVSNSDDSQGVVEHYWMDVPVRKKVTFLKRLAAIHDQQTLVFFNQISSLKNAKVTFEHAHVAVATLDANQSQISRQKALADLKKGKVNLLLTTDVAARGLDIMSLKCVVNYDVPQSSITYIHRVGRVGRQGNTGLVLSLGNDHDLRDLKKLLKDTDYQLKRGHLFKHTVVAKTNDKDQKPITRVKKVHSSNQLAPRANSKKHKKNRWKKQKNKGIRKKYRD